jgi:hypothetical protein
MIEEEGRKAMSNLAFRNSSAMAVAIIYFLVFICSPCEGATAFNTPADGKVSTSKPRDNSPSSTGGHYPEGQIDIPGAMSKEELFLLLGIGVITMVAILVIVGKSAKEEKPLESDDVDSVLTVTDSLASFTVRLKTDSTKTILNGKVSLTHERSGWESVLCFKDIIGVARDLDGSFHERSMVVRTDDVFYVKVSLTVLYQAKVIQQNRDRVTIAFRRI